MLCSFVMDKQKNFTASPLIQIYHSNLSVPAEQAKFCAYHIYITYLNPWSDADLIRTSVFEDILTLKLRLHLQFKRGQVHHTFQRLYSTNDLLEKCFELDIQHYLNPPPFIYSSHRVQVQMTMRQGEMVKEQPFLWLVCLGQFIHNFCNHTIEPLGNSASC